jgi:hypothetical protein
MAIVKTPSNGVYKNTEKQEQESVIDKCPKDTFKGVHNKTEHYIWTNTERPFG